MTPDNTLKIGMVGLGRMGQTRARELSARADVQLCCGADPVPGPFHDIFPSVTLFDDYRAVLSADVDVVFVATPNRFSPEIVIAALEAGKHVFCEKPPGRTVKDVLAMMGAERRHPELKLKFGFNHRYHAGIQEARRIVNGGRLGRLLWVRGIYGKCYGEGFERSWRASEELCGGGILLDQGIHMLDLFRYFCGDFVEVKSMVSTAYWDIPVEDNAFALLRDTQGRTAMLHSSSTHWRHRFNLELYLSEGYLAVNGLLTSSRSYGDESISIAHKETAEDGVTGMPREEIIYFDTDPSWELEIADFLKNVRLGTPVQSGTSLDALKAMELVFSIYDNDSQRMRRSNHDC